jgi:ABC-type dipeptide/oligopeptide/nickel transport system permease component
VTGVVVRRLLAGMTVVIGTTVLIFFVLHLVPGDPVAAILNGAPASRQTIANLRQQLGLDRPLLAQYLSFVGNALRGNLGRSYSTNQPVAQIIAQSAPSTLELTGASLLIGVVLGLAGGVISAVRQGTVVDSVIRAVSLFLAAMPVFWSGILLLLAFSFTLHWFPALGGNGLRALVLPALSLGLACAGVLSRVVRSSVVEVMGQPFVMALRGRGLSSTRLVGKHVLRNALVPTITVLGLILGQALGGAVITETIFSREGLGRVLVAAIENKDYAVVQGAMLVVAVGYVTVNVLVEIIYAYVDPRIYSAMTEA